MSGEVSDLLPTLDLLCAPKKLEREKGEELLRGTTLDRNELTFLCRWIADKLDGLSNWEDVHGGLIAATILLQNLPKNEIEELSLVPELEERVLECHENVEFRVRIAAGLVMGSLCRVYGLPMFKRFIPHVIKGVTDNLERNLDCQATETEASLRELDLAKERDANVSRSSLSIFHDTAGWKHLETWMKCMQQMVTNLDPHDFVQIERTEILDLIFKAVQHTNRFVRETSYDVLATLILGHGCYKDPSATEANYTKVARQLVQGLSDNWSQVRMAASRAVRTFFEVDPPPGHTPEDVYPILLPPMCLNRYYVAEGVRIYSQDTWCRVTKGEGKRLIGTYLAPALDYYIQQTDADNHAVREAACASIAEAASKIDAGLLQPHVTRLLDTLVVCFGDQSWPVRDAACSALGTLLSTFPNEAKAAGHHDLLAEHFLRNLSDSIPSVRDVAAYSIARVLATASDAELTQFYYNHIRDQLAKLKDQPAESHGVESQRVRGKGPGVSHVVVRSGEAAHDARHTDQTMYSCGSLAPKLRKGGGCHDGLNQRASEPWERADGAVRLIGQLAECTPQLFTDQMVEQLLSAAALTHYTHYPYFLETACHVVSQLATVLDKPRFKRHVDNLLVILATAIESDLPLAVVAAEETLNVFVNRLGPNVLRGRVENHMDSRVVRNLLQHLPPATQHA
ncbi:hypothetical protein P879_07806 [Paragonimus westermani]|uniref:Uncharacterized protein n=1 Tax=Paragonimus westermani TaxID=34504 RepID=A0A8T0DJK7_9TREM|nr:hypothetical protein P879_07806 [Paragonimus westermani]